MAINRRCGVHQSETPAHAIRIHPAASRRGLFLFHTPQPPAMLSAPPENGSPSIISRGRNERKQPVPVLMRELSIIWVPGGGECHFCSQPLLHLGCVPCDGGKTHRQPDSRSPEPQKDSPRSTLALVIRFMKHFCLLFRGTNFGPNGYRFCKYMSCYFF